MRIKNFGLDVTRMGNDTEAGYGSDYVTETGDTGFLFWLDNSFAPAVYFLNCSDLGEAFEHAEVVLCDLDEEAEAVARQLVAMGAPIEFVDTYIGEHFGGTSWTADGRLRYTEVLSVRDYKR